MLIYHNKRAWRLRALMWLFLGCAGLAGVGGIAGLIADNPAGYVLGPLFAVLLAVAVWGMSFIARKTVASLHREGERLTVGTVALRGVKEATFPFAGATLSEELHSRTQDDDDGGANVETRSRALHIIGRQAPYILDFTANPAAGEELARTFASSNAQQPQ
jgi:hypothetical protein